MIVTTMKNDHDHHHWSPRHKSTSSTRALSLLIFWNVLAECSVALRSVVCLCAPLCLQCALLLIIDALCCALVCSTVLAVCQCAYEFLMKSENAEEAVVGLTSLTASLPGTTPGTAWVPLNTKLGTLFPRMNKIRREHLSERIWSLALI